MVERAAYTATVPIVVRTVHFVAFHAVTAPNAQISRTDATLETISVDDDNTTRSEPDDRTDRAAVDETRTVAVTNDGNLIGGEDLYAEIVVLEIPGPFVRHTQSLTMPTQPCQVQKRKRRQMSVPPGTHLTPLRAYLLVDRAVDPCLGDVIPFRQLAARDKHTIKLG